MVTFTVEGQPAGQGSMKHVGKGRIIHASKRLGPWRQAIIDQAAKVLEHTDQLVGPLSVIIVVHVKRPLKPKSRWAISRATGDIDKHARAILDALQISQLILDDAHVIYLNIRKHYDPDWQGARITVREGNHG